VLGVSYYILSGAMRFIRKFGNYKIISRNLSGAIAARILRAYGLLATIPFRFWKNKVVEPEHVSHSCWIDYLSKQFNEKGVRILEIGSRNVTGTNLRGHFSNAEYTGFDFYPGENVDVVGDVHILSSYFQEAEKFDLIYSSAVFEHLYMPWVAAQEIQKLLKLGGYIFVETHFSHSSHARPWNFFQFSDMGLKVLFNQALGFEVIDSGMSNPLCGYFSHRADGRLRYRPVMELYCHSEIFCRKISEPVEFEWRNVNKADLVGKSRYPNNQGNSFK